MSSLPYGINWVRSEMAAGRWPRLLSPWLDAEGIHLMPMPDSPGPTLAPVVMDDGWTIGYWFGNYGSGFGPSDFPHDVVTRFYWIDGPVKVALADWFRFGSPEHGIRNAEARGVFSFYSEPGPDHCRRWRVGTHRAGTVRRILEGFWTLGRMEGR